MPTYECFYKTIHQVNVTADDAKTAVRLIAEQLYGGKPSPNVVDTMVDSEDIGDEFDREPGEDGFDEGLLIVRKVPVPKKHTLEELRALKDERVALLEIDMKKMKGGFVNIVDRLNNDAVILKAKLTPGGKV